MMHGNSNIKNSTCFGHVLCPSSGVFYCAFGTGKFPDDGQRRCPKHVEFCNRINLDN
jgi:hypothetical protein